MTSANNRARTAIGSIQTLQLLLFSVICVHRECVIVLSGADISGLWVQIQAVNRWLCNQIHRTRSD